MAIDGIISEEDYNSLPETLREQAYKKGEDGRYYADVTGSDGWAFEHVEGLRSTMRTEREQRKEWERKHRDLAKTLDGIDVEEARKLDDYKKQIEELKKQNPDQRQQERIRELESTYQAKLDEQTAKYRDDVSSRDGRIKQLVVSDKARAILAKLKCIEPELHMHDIDTHTQISEEGAPVVVDRHGDPIPTKKAGVTGTMGLEEYCEELRKKYSHNFQGLGGTGSGSDPGGGTGGTTANGNDLSKLPPDQRLAELRRRQQVN